MIIHKNLRHPDFFFISAPQFGQDFALVLTSLPHSKQFHNSHSQNKNVI